MRRPESPPDRSSTFRSAFPHLEGCPALADEVGLGKTIEAGLVVCQYWAEHRRSVLIICPASLRKQWALELAEKFHLPATILDAKTYRQAEKAGIELACRYSNMSQRAVGEHFGYKGNGSTREQRERFREIAETDARFSKKVKRLEGRLSKS